MIPNKLLSSIIFHTLVFDLYLWTQAEVFTAISDVEPLLETHKRIIDDLDFYIKKEEKRLDILKKHLGIYKKEHEKAMEDITDYLGNPINAFTLIKRLTTDLKYIEDNIKSECIKNITMNHEDVKYPVLEDLTGAAQALTRLQDTYRLDIHDLSEGMLNGVAYSAPMTASDCYELSRTLYDDKDFKNSVEWMKEALRKYKIENVQYPFNEVDILEYIGLSYHLLGDIKNASEWTQKLLVIDSNYDRARGNITRYQETISEEELKKKEQEENGDEQGKADKDNTPQDKRIVYESLCRGEVDIPNEITKRLKCWYEKRNHPFLKLAPIKVEQTYINPNIFMFYEVMSDGEIEHIKELAKPGFKRALVHDSETGEGIPATYRISKSAWLTDKRSPIVAKVTRRVTDMTGLSMLTAEDLQVVNYGIGGHYVPHYDFTRKHEPPYTEYGGNRIATVLFYMSDVAQGGATVFNKLGLSLFPVKGAAAFWLNLHASGEGDLATQHAACPVLRGSKWVSNKWIRQYGQEFLRPCNLEYQEEGILGNISQPVPKNSS